MSGKLTRRQFIAASAGVAAAASLGGASATFGVPGKGGRPTIPPGLLGVQQFSLRDAAARLSIASSTRLGIAPAMGFLGGKDYPHDLGPLVPSRVGSRRCSSSSPPLELGALSSSSRHRTCVSWGASRRRTRSGGISTRRA